MLQDFRTPFRCTRRDLCVLWHIYVVNPVLPIVDSDLFQLKQVDLICPCICLALLITE
jgi:hypothetical protein